MSEVFPGVPSGGRSARIARAETELVEYRDRVLRAVSTIVEHDLRLWFEPDWIIAQQVSSICPWCAVCSVPPEALWMHDLTDPPPWRKRQAENGEV